MERNIFLHGKNPKQTGKFPNGREGGARQFHSHRIIQRHRLQDTLAIYPQYMNDDLRVMN